MLLSVIKKNVALGCNQGRRDRRGTTLFRTETGLVPFVAVTGVPGAAYTARSTDKTRQPSALSVFPAFRDPAPRPCSIAAYAPLLTNRSSLSEPCNVLFSSSLFIFPWVLYSNGYSLSTLFLQKNCFFSGFLPIFPNIRTGVRY